MKKISLSTYKDSLISIARTIKCMGNYILTSSSCAFIDRVNIKVSTVSIRWKQNFWRFGNVIPNPRLSLKSSQHATPEMYIHVHMELFRINLQIISILNSYSNMGWNDTIHLSNALSQSMWNMIYIQMYCTVYIDPCVYYKTYLFRC